MITLIEGGDSTIFKGYTKITIVNLITIKMYSYFILRSRFLGVGGDGAMDFFGKKDCSAKDCSSTVNIGS